MVKWILSEKCNDCPECGPRGRQDIYGLGPGIYPESKAPPTPAHRGCNCFKALV